MDSKPMASPSVSRVEAPQDGGHCTPVILFCCTPTPLLVPLGMQPIKALTPEEAVHDKHHWMVVTVPEQPIAGQEFTVYFNTNASDNLR